MGTPPPPVPSTWALVGALSLSALLCLALNLECDSGSICVFSCQLASGWVGTRAVLSGEASDLSLPLRACSGADSATAASPRSAAQPPPPPSPQLFWDLPRLVLSSASPPAPCHGQVLPQPLPTSFSITHLRREFHLFSSENPGQTQALLLS